MSFSVRWVLVALGVVAVQWFVPVTGLANDSVFCTLQSTRLDEVTVDAITGDHEEVTGSVEVSCTNAASQPLMVELALAERSERPAPGASSAVRVELFLDKAMLNALPIAEPRAQDFAQFIVDRSSTLRLTIPIYARVALVRIESAGLHLVGREIGLVYRTREVAAHP